MHFLSEFMTKVDGGAMYFSLEARAPFLDQALWEFASQLPAGIRFHGNRLKSVLREIVSRRVGPDVASGRKRGFTIPVERWLASQWSGRLRELKGESLLAREGWLRQGALASAIDDALLKRHVPQQLWYVLVLEHWLRRQKALAAERSASCAPLFA
jgi:asparagine synthase (glutamine-hydrolysing)